MYQIRMYHTCRCTINSTAVSLFVYSLVVGGTHDTYVPPKKQLYRYLFIRQWVVVRMISTFRPWTHTSDDSYIYRLSLVVATATVSYLAIMQNTYRQFQAPGTFFSNFGDEVGIERSDGNFCRFATLSGVHQGAHICLATKWINEELRSQSRIITEYLEREIERGGGSSCRIHCCTESYTPQPVDLTPIP